ncbi:MAG: exosortase/archaeosortase family protein [Kiritimatiellia bacterium]
MNMIKNDSDKGGLPFSGRLIIFCLLLPVFWLMYKTTVIYTMGMFREPLESMSHGWLIPFVSLYALWLQKDQIRRAASRPSWTGAVLVLFCLIVFWFGSRGGQSRIEQVSLIGLLWSVPFAFWGRGVAKLLIFPVGYLVFTIPLSSFLDIFTVTLRLLSTSIVCTLMNGLGYEIQRVGNFLFSRIPGAEFSLSVADGCSGIESFFAVMALTAAYAWLKQKTLLQKIILFIFAVPIAVAGNSVRLASDCLVALWFGQDAAGGYYHTYSGFAIAFFDVFLVVLAGKLVARMDGWVLNSAKLPACLKNGKPVAPGALHSGIVSTYTLPLVVFAMIAFVCFVRFRIPEPSYAEADFMKKALPEKVHEFTGTIPWFCHNESCLFVDSQDRLQKRSGQSDGFVCPACGEPMHIKSLGETTDMPGDTVILKRNYRSGDGMQYNMNVVIGGRSRYSIHRAEQCLPAQGFLMENTGTITFSPDNLTPWNARLIEASRDKMHKAALVYWFVSEDRVCSSHLERILLDVWDRSVHNRINRWIMFSVFIPSGLGSPESIESFEKFLSEFYPQVYLKVDVVND